MKKVWLFGSTIIVLVGLVFLGSQYISVDDLILENPGWNGLSALSGTNVQPLYNVSDLSGSGPGFTFLITSPLSNYSAGEAENVAAFLKRGGRVVVMDDQGTANGLLSAIGSPITVNPTPLCDYDSYYVNYSFPIVKDFRPSEETAGVSQLVFNHPASLNVSGGAQPLAYTTGQGWLDGNDNAKLDGDERLGTYCVIAKASYGDGELLVIGDPDIFINSMLSMGDNRAFMSGILRGNVWVDSAHGRGVTPAGMAYYVLKYDLAAQVAVIIMAFACGLAYLNRRGIIEWLNSMRSKRYGN